MGEYRDLLEILETYDDSYSEQLYYDVLKELDSFGEQVSIDDLYLLYISKQNAREYILNNCNLSAVPEGLYYTYVNMICGRFLKMLKDAGRLDGSFDLSAAISSIQEGDTQVSFAVGQGSTTPEQRFDGLLDFLIHGRDGDLTCYRRLKW